MLSNTCRTSRVFAQRVGGRLLSRRSGSTTTTAHRLAVAPNCTATRRVPIRAMALAVDNLLLDNNRCFSTKGASSSAAADEPPKEEVPEPATDEPVMEDKETPSSKEEEEEETMTTDEQVKEAAAASEEEDATTTTEEESSVGDDDESILKLQAEIQSLKDQLLRSLAEQENTRRIAKRDVASAKQFAIKSFAKSLLEVSDNLSRAMESVPEELLQQDDDDDQENHDAAVLATLHEGIRMTEDGLTKTFASHGITKYGEIGQPFNPNIHDALFEYPDPKAEPGTLGQVMKKGYMLHDRVLRPAEVGVVKKE